MEVLELDPNVKTSLNSSQNCRIVEAGRDLWKPSGQHPFHADKGSKDNQSRFLRTMSR